MTGAVISEVHVVHLQRLFCLFPRLVEEDLLYCALPQHGMRLDRAFPALHFDHVDLRIIITVRDPLHDPCTKLTSHHALGKHLEVTKVSRRSSICGHTATAS